MPGGDLAKLFFFVSYATLNFKQSDWLQNDKGLFLANQIA